MTPMQRKQAQFEQENVEAAKLILQNIEYYGGEAAGLVIWASSGTPLIPLPFGVYCIPHRVYGQNCACRIESEFIRASH